MKKAGAKPKSKGRDLPRYKAIVQYEQDFKSSYARILGEGLAEVTSLMLQMVRHKEDDLLTS